MYCNINEAFNNDSYFMKNYLQNELNNHKLLEKNNNFDNYFDNDNQFLHSKLPDNITEHFNPITTIHNKAKELLNKKHKSEHFNNECDNKIDHVINCSYCRNKFFKMYFNNIFKNFGLENTEIKNILIMLFIIILLIIVIKLIWKL